MGTGAVTSTIASEGIDGARLVGHSLGGVVVSAVAASGFPTRSVVNVDQPLELDAFHAALQASAPALRDPASFPMVMNALFDDMTGDLHFTRSGLGGEEVADHRAGAFE